MIGGFQQYSPMDPESPKVKAAEAVAFVKQAVSDIKRKLKVSEGLGEKNLKILVIMAENIFNGGESTEKEMRTAK